MQQWVCRVLPRGQGGVTAKALCRGGEKGLLCALELSRHWSSCLGQQGRPLARWRAAGREGFLG